MATIGAFKVVIRPALALMMMATVIGFAARPIMQHLSYEKLASTGYLNPQQWRFGTRAGASAQISTLAPDGTETPVKPERGLLWGDTDKGVSITIDHPGETPDTVFLRNALSREQTNFPRTDRHLTFEAKASQPFPILMNLRDGRYENDKTGALWSHSLTLEPDWKTYDVAVPTRPLFKTLNLSVIFSIQLGSSSGKVSLRNVHLR